MLWIVILFLVSSLLFYCLLGGADFGAGALELFIPQKDRQRHEDLVAHAMGPVWEANHIWLIILIVILFNAFPLVYTQCSIYFHVPLVLMLIGIVFRGCAFTFRNYDAIKDNTHRYYSLAFGISSLMTPVMFGMIMGGMFFGVDPKAPTYFQKYIISWLNLPCLALGIFVLSLFTYLASVYLIGESEAPETRTFYLHCSQKTSLMMLGAGALVFFLAQWSPHPLLKLFFTDPISVTCFAAASILTVIFWRKITQDQLSEWSIRLIAGAQVSLVLLAWLAVTFPNVLFYRDGAHLSLLDAAAPAATVTILAWSLIVGTLLFLPILLYLISVFKINRGTKDHQQSKQSKQSA